MRIIVAAIGRMKQGPESELSARYQKRAAQAAFERWLAVALLSFGRPGGDGNRLAIEAGLKTRDSAEIRRDFLADVEPIARAAGLSVLP